MLYQYQTEYSRPGILIALMCVTGGHTAAWLHVHLLPCTEHAFVAMVTWVGLTCLGDVAQQ